MPGEQLVSQRAIQAAGVSLPLLPPCAPPAPPVGCVPWSPNPDWPPLLSYGAVSLTLAYQGPTYFLGWSGQDAAGVYWQWRGARGRRLPTLFCARLYAAIIPHRWQALDLVSIDAIRWLSVHTAVGVQGVADGTQITVWQGPPGTG